MILASQILAAAITIAAVVRALHLFHSSLRLAGRLALALVGTASFASLSAAPLLHAPLQLLLGAAAAVLLWKCRAMRPDTR